MTADEHMRRDVMANWDEPPEPHDIDLDLILDGLGVPHGDGVARAVTAEAWQAGWAANQARAALSAPVLAAVSAEADRARREPGGHPMLHATVSEADRMAILAEAAGAVAREMNEERLGTLDGDWRDRRARLLLRVAGDALAWAEHLAGGAR